MFSKSCLDLLQEESKQVGLITFCKDLDQAIGDAITVGLITEFCGPPGSGKTQMCLQLCVNVQIPPQLGGLGGKALFLDTNFGFNPNRLKEIATACVEHCYKIVKTLEKSNQFTVDSVLEGVFYNYVPECDDLTKGIDTLEDMLGSGIKIKLVVIDSLSFLIRNSIENTLERIRFDYRTLTRLQVLAQRFKFAIVVTNDVTTRFDPKQPDSSTVVPALGNSHSHRVNQRITLGRVGGHQSGLYTACVEKGLRRPRMTVRFQISHAGIRGVRNR